LTIFVNDIKNNIRSIPNIMQKLIKLISSCTLVSALALSSNFANSTPIAINGDSFGTITTFDGSLVEFGGDGIPSNATSFSDLVDGNGNTLRLGLSITQRFGADTPTNDGAGTFGVIPGVDDDGRTFWNFSFFAEIQGQLDLTDLNLELLYDLDSAAGTDESALGVINLSSFLTAGSLISEGSQNLAFGYLATGIPGVTVPSLINFDPNNGEYSFALREANFGSVGVNAVVNQVSAPSISIFASMLLGGLLLRRRTK
jgi:hypothetical protein